MGDDYFAELPITFIFVPFNRKIIVKHHILILPILLSVCLPGAAREPGMQPPDTAGIYGDRADSLEAGRTALKLRSSCLPRTGIIFRKANLYGPR